MQTANRAKILPGVLASVLLISAGSALARGGYDHAQVVRVVPQYERVSYQVPVQRCEVQQVAYRTRSGSAAAPVLGAIIGGAIGNAVGHDKSNKRVGALAGAALGGSIAYDMSRQVGYRDQQVCTQVYERHEEQRLTGYDVTYRYQGRLYQTHTTSHPGDRIKVRVDVRPVY